MAEFHSAPGWGGPQPASSQLPEELDGKIRAHYPFGGAVYVASLFPGLSPFRVMARALEIGVRKGRDNEDPDS